MLKCTSRMTLPSGGTCGVTPSMRLPLLNGHVEAAPTNVKAGRAASDTYQIRCTHLGSQCPAERVGRLDDTRLNHHLPHRDVDLCNQCLDFFEFRRDVGDEQLVGPSLRDHT